MTIVAVDRLSDSPYIEMVSEGYTLSAGSTIRPSEIHWHMVIVKLCGKPQLLVVGPLTSSGLVEWGEGGEIIWIKLKLGTYFPHMPLRNFLNIETPLPGASSNKFWLKGSAWEYPDYDNVETFINRLVREDVLVSDPVVHATLQDQAPDVASRTVRHRFQYATGLTQNHIRQYERAQQAAALLNGGVSILDTVYVLGYFDQPHLTRSLKRFVGKTPAQLYVSPASCHSVQDPFHHIGYDADVLSR